MTYQELNRYFCIQKRIKQLNAELSMMPYLSATNYDGMPHGTGISDTVHAQFVKREKLIDKLNYQKARAIDELDKLNDFIESIDDVEMQTIIHARFIECRSYDSIGNEMFMDRTTISKKIDRFLGGGESDAKG